MNSEEGIRSGMRYYAMESLLKNLKEEADKMIKAVEAAEARADDDSELAQNYDGEAARTFRSSLHNEAEEIKRLLNKNIKDLEFEFNENQKERQKTDSNLSAASPQSRGV